MPDNSGTFADVFTFTRDRTAPYTDADGQPQTAPVDTPRLDHDGQGNVLGLRIEGRPTAIQVDKILLAADLAGEPALGTVLHDYIDLAGTRWMRAIYTRSPRVTVEGCLAMQGWHRRIAFFPEFMVRRADIDPLGPVRFGGESWQMAGLLVDIDGNALDIGDGQTSLLIEA